MIPFILVVTFVLKIASLLHSRCLDCLRPERGKQEMGVLLLGFHFIQPQVVLPQETPRSPSPPSPALSAEPGVSRSLGGVSVSPVGRPWFQG